MVILFLQEPGRAEFPNTALRNFHPFPWKCYKLLQQPVKRAALWSGYSSTTEITKLRPLSKMNHLGELSAAGSVRCFQCRVLHDSSKTNKTNFLNETFTPVHEEGHLLKRRDGGAIVLCHAICLYCIYLLILHNRKQQQRLWDLRFPRWQLWGNVMYSACQQLN